MKRFSVRGLSRILTFFYFLSLVPLIWIGFYNFPSADDLSMTIQARDALLAGGVPMALETSIAKAVNTWATWTGYFTSSFFMSFTPAIFGIRWYVLAAPILIGMLTVSVWYFLYALLVRAGGMDRYCCRCITVITLFVMIQCMPEGMARVEGFYWYCGGVNYTGMLSLMLLYLGFLLSAAYAKRKGSRRLAYVLAVLFSFFMGGISYMSALTCAILMVLLLIAIFFLKGRRDSALFSICSLGREKGRRARIQYERSIRLLWLPAVLMLAGFAVSCAAPGNASRAASLNGMGPVKTVFVCLYYTLYYCVTQWTRWEILVLLVIAGIIFWKAADGMNLTFQSPVFVFVLLYGLASANIAPCIYAEGNIEAGRIRAIYYIQYILCLVLAEGYLTGWVKSAVGKRGKVTQRVLSKNARRAVRGMILFLVFGSALCCYTDRNYYAMTSAAEDLADGDAQRYGQENEERLSMLLDENNTDPVLPAYTAKPELLYFSDAGEDPDDWISRAMARYFHKNSVRRAPEQMAP